MVYMIQCCLLPSFTAQSYVSSGEPSPASMGNESPPLSLFLSSVLGDTPLGYQKCWEGCVYIFAKLLKKKKTTEVDFVNINIKGNF